MALALAVMISSATLAMQVPAPAPDPRTASVKPLEVAPWPNIRQPLNGDLLEGTVTEVTRDSITLKLPKGQTQRFPVGSCLASGEFFPDQYPRSYRLSDVAVGDKIHISCLKLNGVLRCETICIDRRPGGRVPPCPGEEANHPRPWHEYMNAKQDFEEKGIPIPVKLVDPNRPGMLNGKPIPQWMIPPLGVEPGPLPEGVQPPPKTDPPPSIKGG
jgi:hypothetical protein